MLERNICSKDHPASLSDSSVEHRKGKLRTYFSCSRLFEKLGDWLRADGHQNYFAPSRLLRFSERLVPYKCFFCRNRNSVKKAGAHRAYYLSMNYGGRQRLGDNSSSLLRMARELEKRGKNVSLPCHAGGRSANRFRNFNTVIVSCDVYFVRRVLRRQSFSIVSDKLDSGWQVQFQIFCRKDRCLMDALPLQSRMHAIIHIPDMYTTIVVAPFYFLLPDQPSPFQSSTVPIFLRCTITRTSDATP